MFKEELPEHLHHSLHSLTFTHFASQFENSIHKLSSYGDKASKVQSIHIFVILSILPSEEPLASTHHGRHSRNVKRMYNLPETENKSESGFNCSKQILIYDSAIFNIQSASAVPGRGISAEATAPEQSMCTVTPVSWASQTVKTYPGSKEGCSVERLYGFSGL